MVQHSSTRIDKPQCMICDNFSHENMGQPFSRPCNSDSSVESAPRNIGDINTTLTRSRSSRSFTETTVDRLRTSFRRYFSTPNNSGQREGEGTVIDEDDVNVVLQVNEEAAHQLPDISGTTTSACEVGDPEIARDVDVDDVLHLLSSPAVLCEVNDECVSPGEDLQESIAKIHPYLQFSFLTDVSTITWFKRNHVLIIMRGLPGSGKSTLTKSILLVYANSINDPAR